MRAKIARQARSRARGHRGVCHQSLRARSAVRGRLPDPRSGASDGQPLVYLDSASTSQKPAVVIDGARRAPAQPQRERPPRRLRARPGGRRRLRGRPRARRRVHGRRRERGTIFTKNVDRGDQPRRLLVGARERAAPGDAVLITQTEHHANIVPWQVLCRERGASLRYLEVDERGELSLDALDAELARGDVRLVAVAHVSNVLGTINPVAEIVRARARRGRGRRSSTARRRCRRCRSTSARSAPTSTPGPATRRSARPASACSTAAASCSSAMEPFLTGGDMIASVDFDSARPGTSCRGSSRPARR